MKIAVTGSTGMIGTAVCDYFRRRGDQLFHIIRSETKYKGSEPTVFWNIEKGSMDSQALEGMDAVVHLAGASIADRRWTKEYKEVILKSREEGTRLLSQTLAGLKRRPKVFISVSAVGYYGAHDTSMSLTEESPPGKDFLAQVCQHWEKETQAAREAGIRTVILRIGMVLSREGGALGKMRPVFKMGLGGRLGNGHQIISCIALDDIPSIMQFIMEHDNINGAVNVVSPEAVSNAEFTKILGKVIRRPTLFPVPPFAVRLLFGEMADVLLLSGARVIPQKLKQAGYSFRYTHLEDALKAVI